MLIKCCSSQLDRAVLSAGGTWFGADFLALQRLLETKRALHTMAVMDGTCDDWARRQRCRRVAEEVKATLQSADFRDGAKVRTDPGVAPMVY